MSFVIAGVVLLLSITIGVISYITAPLFEKENSDDGKEDGKTTPVITLSTFFSKTNWKQMVFVCCISITCALAAGLSYNSGASAIDLCRQIVVALVLFAAMIIDSKTRLIPNLLILVALGLGVLILVIEFIFCKEVFLSSLIMSIAGFLCCVVLFYVISRLTKEGIGMGDVKLISVMGLLLGLSTTLMSVLFSLILCTVASVVLLFGKKKNKTDRIPFAPFMFFGYILMFILFSI